MDRREISYFRDATVRCSSAPGAAIGVRRFDAKPLAKLLFTSGFGFRSYLREFAVQSVDGRFECANLGPGSSEITLGSGDLGLNLAPQPEQRLLKKLDIRLKASGAPLHLLFGGADFESPNILGDRWR